jgi:hypothetical protein
MMIRNLKVLGLALMAVFAMAAVTASAASAQNALITSDGPVTLTLEETGTEANRLTAFGAFTECPGSKYTGHLVTTEAQTSGKRHSEAAIGKNLIPVPATTATITPHYKQPCKGSLGTVMTIDMNGCDYVLHSGPTTGVQPPEGATYETTMDIVCPPNKTITMTIWLSAAAHTSEPLAPKCILHIGEQKGLKGAHLTDTKLTDGHIELTGEIVGLIMKQTRNSILCPAGTETKEAKLDLDLTIKGHNSLGEPTGISLSHT